ncbi:radical SAM protein [Litchfieldella xinjiangensis]|uniref:radical SAM protein n=1 Tax=Litchfieldella xinjiangensis TaxID=1166948 RepID=UPI0009E09C9E|nr:radical SAM protein [Halomonas xinjiangensis]
MPSLPQYRPHQAVDETPDPLSPAPFHPDIDAAAFAAALSASNATGNPLSLYVHLPFCRQHCHHCVRDKIAAREAQQADPYLQRLEREMVLVASHLDRARKITQLVWGGGTPTFLTLGQMSRLIDMLDAHFTLSGDRNRDYAIEIDPREANVFTLRHLQTLGFNRLSLGVADLDLRVQQAINRIQPRVLTENLVDEARRLGFQTLSLELVYGLPQQTQDSLSETLEQVIALAPDRVSLTPYMHWPERYAAQRSIDVALLPDAHASGTMADAAREQLVMAGYVHLGRLHFALPDDSLAIALHQGTLRHGVLGYSGQAPTDHVGFGVSAISQVDGLYAQNATLLPDYVMAIDSDRLATIQGLVAVAGRDVAQP